MANKHHLLGYAKRAWIIRPLLDHVHHNGDNSNTTSRCV